LKSGSFKLLEASGPVQACKGITLPFTAAKSVPFLGFTPIAPFFKPF